MASDFTHTLCISYNDFFLSTVATIGFVDTTLSISENGGEIEFEIAVLDGNLRFDVSVDFATADGAALGIQYCIYSRLQLKGLKSTLPIFSWVRL